MTSDGAKSTGKSRQRSAGRTIRYREIADELRARVQAGDYVAGRLLPSEAELSARYRASRVTIRRALEALRTPTPESLPQTEGPDLTDGDALVKHATTLKLGGYLVQEGVPHVTINGAICKAGDTITVGPKDQPVFLHIVSVNPQEVTLRLNEVIYTLPMKK